MDICQALNQLGYTDYEAKVYIALLQSPDATGYEASRVSGVPRAKVYEVLESLERKGAVFTSTVDGKQLYRGLNPAILVSRHRRQTEELLLNLEPALSSLGGQYNPEALLNIRGVEAVNEQVVTLLKKAQARVLVTGLPTDLAALTPHLKACLEHGVQVYILSYGEFSLPGAKVFKHKVSGTQYLQVAALGRWLALVVDHDEAILARLTGGSNTSALWTRHPAVVFGVSGWISHDITLFRMESLLEEASSDVSPALLTQISNAMNELQPLWMLVPGEKQDDIQVPDLSVQDLFRRLETRGQHFQELTGTVLFVLPGEEGGTWQVTLTGKKAFVQAVPPDTTAADLVITMTVEDFKALFAGTLPLSAFVTRGRMKVEGNITLAAILHGLSGRG